MASKVEIVNAALIQLAAEPIISLSDPIPSAILADRIYDIVVEYVLGEGEWSKAKFRTQLNLTTTTPEYEFNNEFQLPNSPKFLKIISLNELSPGDIEHAIEGDKLLTDEGSVKITYIGFISDTEAYGPYITESVVNRLSVQMCYALTSNRNLVQDLRNQYETTLRDCLSKDGQQGNPKEISSSTLTDIR